MRVSLFVLTPCALFLEWRRKKRTLQEHSTKPLLGNSPRRLSVGGSLTLTQRPSSPSGRERDAPSPPQTLPESLFVASPPRRLQSLLGLQESPVRKGAPLCRRRRRGAEKVVGAVGCYQAVSLLT